MTLTAFLWVMGHFSSEIKFLGEKSDTPLVKVAVDFFYHVTPDFALFNYRDFYRSAVVPEGDWFLTLLFYLLFYVGTMLY